MPVDVPVEVIDDADTPGCATLFVPVGVAGRVARCVLDSGSPRTYFTDVLPGSRLVGPRSTSGLFGTSVVDEYTVADVSLGALHRSQLEVDVVGDAPHAAVGLDVLGHDTWTLDLRRRTLSTRRGSALGDGRPMQRARNGHVLLPVHWDGLEARALWDTGAGITVVDHRFAASHPALFTAAGRATATDASGRHISTDLAHIAPYEIQGQPFGGHIVAITDLSATGEPLDLALGYPTIRQARWTMDFARERWTVGQPCPATVR